MADPWVKFYTSDWRSDPALKMCSMAARGLWIEMICLMHEATPYGHLLVNGHSIADAQLASLVGTTPEQITALLGELDAAGVFSRTRSGVIYSRKLTRMAKKAAAARNNGRKGGNPNLRNEKDNSQSDNPADNHRLKTQNPEARGHTNGGGGGARGLAEIATPTYRERILAAIGIGPKGIVGPSRFLGSQADMAEAQRWLELPGLTIDNICAEVSRICASMQDGPPSSFKYFTRAMQRLSGSLTAAPLTPAETRYPGTPQQNHTAEELLAMIRNRGEKLEVNRAER